VVISGKIILRMKKAKEHLDLMHWELFKHFEY